MNQKLLSCLVPVAAWGLSLACPLVPFFVWEALINGVIEGNVTLEHIQNFLKEHNIHADYAPKDFPAAPTENHAVQAWKDRGG